MATVIEGSSWLFNVVAKNKNGRIVPITDATVTLGAVPALGSVSVNGDGSNGVFLAVTEGVESLTPSAAGVSGAPFPLSVTPDVSVATVEIVPA